MKKLLFSLLAVIVLAGAAAAQGQNEVSATALFVRENPSFNSATFRYNRATDQYGAAGSYTRFAKNKPIGLTVEIGDTATGNSSTDANLLTGTVGITLKSRQARVAPFLKATAGVARLAARNALLRFDTSDAGFAFTAGGGLDVRVNKSVAVRLIEVDYLGTRVFQDTVPHARVGAGLVFQF